MENLIRKIENFKQRDKFSKEAWNERGLNPSSEDVCAELTFHFNNCATILINATRQNDLILNYTKTLKESLFALEKNNYDTEEREFIGDLYFELGKYAEIDFGATLDEWMYDSKIVNLFNRERKILETLKQPCTNCSKDLETHIMQKGNGIPDSSWFIGKCSGCGELNVISLQPGIKETRFGNYEYIAILHKEEYNFEQALARLKELKAGLQKD